MEINQKGISLVEVLGALVLVSLIGIIAWTTLTIGMRHGVTETNKTILQQDANIMVSGLMAAHRSSEKYSIIFEDNHMSINSCDTKGSCQLYKFGGAYNFSGSSINNIEINTTSDAPVIISELKPKQNHTTVTLRIADLSNEKKYLVVNTTLSRMLSEEIEGRSGSGK